jgi:hypothetical protein
MDACATNVRELSAVETALVGGAGFGWDAFFGHVAAGAVAGGLAGSIAAGVGAGPGAVAGGLLGGIEYSISALVEQYF